jgi:uncharacterized protein (UPF0332 family)
VTPESTRYLEKAQQCLVNARAELAVKLSNDAGRNAYLAAFHAAQALIFERTGRIAKTHGGVHREFARLAKVEPGLDRQHPVFLTAAYNLKSVADYETGPGSVIPPERAASAVESAQAFVDGIANAIR